MVSLNQINEEVDNKYGPFIVDDVPGGEVVLRNPIRLAKDERHRLGVLHKELQDGQANATDPESMLDAAVDLLKLVAVGDGGKRLTDEIGDDAAKLMYLIQLYAEATQLGEALPSES